MITKRENNNARKTFVVKKSLLGTLNIIFASLYIFISLQLVATGGRLAALEKKERELHKSNEELNLQLLESSSLISLSNKSTELGFSKPDKTIYLSAEDLVANVR